jgi:hypothetical protein
MPKSLNEILGPIPGNPPKSRPTTSLLATGGTAAFKDKAIRRAKRVGVGVAAHEMHVEQSVLRGWVKAAATGLPSTVGTRHAKADDLFLMRHQLNADGRIVSEEKLNALAGERRPASPSRDDGLFVISGRVSGLLTSMTNWHDRTYHSPTAVAVRRVDEDWLRLSDSESDPIFECRIGLYDVVGNFSLPDHEDDVKAVVTWIDDTVLYAHALVWPRSGVLCMHHFPMGRKALRRSMVKQSIVFGLVGWLGVLAGVSLLFDTGSIPFSHQAAASFLTVLAATVGTSLLRYRAHLGECASAEQLMKVLGFKRPDIVNLSAFTAAGTNRQDYRLRDALRAYDSLSPAKAAHGGNADVDSAKRPEHQRSGQHG